MEKKIRLNIHGYLVDVVVKSSTRFCKTSHYTYGQIYISCPLSTPETEIKKYIEKIYNKTILANFSKEFLYSSDYVYILGEKRRIIRPNTYQDIKPNDLYIRNDDELKLKLNKLSKDIITSRVRKYEEIMNTGIHDIKITSMSAARGKNYVRKKLLTFSNELIHFSLELIDAIVIHELAHDFQANHSSAFYKIVYNYCPNYDIKIKKLTYGEKK